MARRTVVRKKEKVITNVDGSSLPFIRRRVISSDWKEKHTCILFKKKKISSWKQIILKKETLKKKEKNGVNFT